MLYGNLENQLLEECKKIPPDFTKIQSLIDAGADVNTYEFEVGETLLSDIIHYYSLVEYPDECDDCKRKGRNPCKNCPVNYWNDYDGRYLPEIVALFLRNGYDVSRKDGAFGGKCLLNLSASSSDKYILDATKLLLNAGANPNYMVFDNTTVLSWIGTEESAEFCLYHNHPNENLYATMYELMDSYLNGKDYKGVRHYTDIIGKRIDKIYICHTKDNKKAAVFDYEYGDEKIYQNCFYDKMIFECESLPLCISKILTIMINPNAIPTDASEQFDICEYFEDCIGVIIKSISFGHRNVRKGRTDYGQTILKIGLSNKKKIVFTDNFGEMEDKEMLPRFTVVE